MAFIPKQWQNAPNTTTPISAAALIDLETRLSSAMVQTGTVNTSIILQNSAGAGNYDPSAGIPNQGAPQTFGISTGQVYNDSSAGNIFQLASYVNNTGSRATVAVFGEGKGHHVFGGNFVGYTVNTADTAVGIEIDVGNIGGGGQVSGSATGLAIVDESGNIAGSPANTANGIQILGNNASSGFAVGINLRPNAVVSTGSGIEFASLSCTWGINFAGVTSMTAGIVFAATNSYTQGALYLIGQNIATDTGTGMQIGTATSQKIALWGAPPVVQPQTSGTTSGFTAGGGTAMNSASTSTGGTGSSAYTFGDVVLALKQVGLMKS